MPKLKELEDQSVHINESFSLSKVRLIKEVVDATGLEPVTLAL
jgi:hypothetical protein